MIVQFSKWGNSLAVRIPSHALRDAGISEGMSADLVVDDGKLIVTPIAKRRRYDLDDLLARVTEENLHAPAIEEPPVGSETW